jgi:hypothetical protein
VTPSRKRRTVGARRNRPDPASLRERLAGLMPDAPLQYHRELAERLHSAAPVKPPSRVPHVRARIHEGLLQRLLALAPASPEDARYGMAESFERLIPQRPPATVKPAGAPLPPTPRRNA